ncbi:MAG: hypothetical protein WC374_12550 [Phycisphaerae bacterium]|jgi:hypothetical protein
MKKNTALKILNLILAVMLINQVVTGLMADELSAGTFEILHEGAGLVLAGLIVLHLVLNFGWIKTSYFKVHKIRQA